MNNEELQTSIQALGQKLRGLLGAYKEQETAVQQLQKENRQLRQKVSSEGPLPANFSKSPESGTITKNEARARELGCSIDGYIKEIDKSIAYLEQLQ